MLTEIKQQAILIDSDIKLLENFITESTSIDLDWKQHFSAQISDLERKKDIVASTSFKENLIPLATQAHNHLQIQIDAIRQVLIEKGYSQLKVKSQKPKKLKPPQVEPSTVYATPIKVRELIREHRQLPQSPKLEDLGLSNLGLELLHAKLDQPGNSPLPPSIHFVSPIPHHRMSDPNSLFNELIDPIALHEFNALPDFVTSQYSLVELNEIINEINDLITDKRFMDNSNDPDRFTLEELAISAKMGIIVLTRDSNKLKAAMVGLLNLKKIATISSQTYSIIV